MDPVLQPGEFVYCTADDAAATDAVCTFREAEGLTLILSRDAAERRGLPFTYPCRMITLNVYSNLESIGLLAAVTAALTHENISMNAVSAYHHDHLFVRTEDAAQALDVLLSLAGRR